ncbi:Na(+)/H(+) antiporter subunit D [Alisedimentitalea sp. MJ-SS2]|uniref:Na(+)/H(+) antiporter subunit D n=1 Tax=Aliisedimentitalea sp. MJ-SS2 TaxID=3049795 RepID=UPI002912DFDD|nr:Na(+)/H(+) antiporter subunit D [Alisedimentitalea sp. MJ-SS2]MDU8928840.1 Na(+)/H(+) antiporter subunit D [Alisedimentitalea sp. MJ-SS2]
MVEMIPPAFLFFAAAVIVPFLPMMLRPFLLIAVPILSGLIVWSLPEGMLWQVGFFGFELELMRVDALSRIFALIFSLAAFLGNLYAWHVRDTVQQVAALLYAGAAIGAVFAGDLITLFFYWEGTAIASVFLIWARRTEGAYHTGLRYLIIQIASGVILLAGAVLWHAETGSITFERMTLGSPATYLIFFSFGMKCAFPLLHNWLQDAYPAATVTGTVILSAFTTKLAVYALARGFAGTEVLIYIGALMTLFPIFYAVIENDLRRVLAYSLNNQLGFMVVGIGIGTELALNGTAAHAFAHILYKALLFMSVGAVLFRTGTAKGSELGGLYKTMPLTMIFCVVGAASISAFPLFSGFVTKSLILSASAKEHYNYIWAILLFASAGVFHHSGIKIPYFAFFAHDSGKRPKEAPVHMLLAMGITAFLCVAIGVYPEPLYALLPYEVKYESYTTTHVITQLQLLFFSALAFTVLMRTGIYPPELKSVNLDFDWSYRRAGRAVLGYFHAVAGLSGAYFTALVGGWIGRVYDRFHHSTGPEGRLAQSWPTGAMVLWIAILLGVTMAVNFLN